MLVRSFQTKDNQTIYIHPDDMQIATEMMTGARLIREAMQQWQKRGTLEALLKVDPVTRTLIQGYMRDLDKSPHAIYDALASTVYDKLLMLYTKGEDY